MQLIIINCYKYKNRKKKEFDRYYVSIYVFYVLSRSTSFYSPVLEGKKKKCQGQDNTQALNNI